VLFRKLCSSSAVSLDFWVVRASALPPRQSRVKGPNQDVNTLNPFGYLTSNRPRRSILSHCHISFRLWSWPASSLVPVCRPPGFAKDLQRFANQVPSGFCRAVRIKGWQRSRDESTQACRRHAGTISMTRCREHRCG